jgi:hypothetical protein
MNFYKIPDQFSLKTVKVIKSKGSLNNGHNKKSLGTGQQNVM